MIEPGPVQTDWTGRRWRLGHPGRPPIAPQMLLLPDQRVGGSDDDSRRSWAFRDGALTLSGADGMPSVRFDRLKVHFDEWRLGGTELATGAAIELNETLPAQVPIDRIGSVDAVPLHGGPRRDFLVIVHAGSRTLHHRWERDIDDSARNWDLLLSCSSGDPGPGRDEADLFCEQSHIGTTRLLYCLLHPESALWDYRYIMLCDEQIMLRWSDLNRLFVRMVEHRLLIGQPAMGPDGHVEHEITRARPDLLLRYTTFVDRAAPVFEPSVLRLAVPTFGTVYLGQGMDHLWCFLIGRPRGRMAVIDDVAVTLTDPIGGRYRAEIGDVEEELICRTYGLQPDARELGFIAR